MPSIPCWTECVGRVRSPHRPWFPAPAGRPRRFLASRRGAGLGPRRAPAAVAGRGAPSAAPGKAAKRPPRRRLENRTPPERIVADTLASCAAAKREIAPRPQHRRHEGLDDRAENGHPPSRAPDAGPPADGRPPTLGHRALGGAPPFRALHPPPLRPNHPDPTVSRPSAPCAVRLAPPTQPCRRAGVTGPRRAAVTVPFPACAPREEQ